ncbi:hypothetical protein SAMN05444362_103216 [Dysgonomonas macrotermitis]|uniref:Uncharacterized protein n=1 Tax=Dysgonomonas macrotermitis TaxID=1346286 RepID=A0A1M4YND9_9BACT|nr:hypothetical protein SAMN05444362_103216 [Dysgonomonas macrotermitis]
MGYYDIEKSFVAKGSHLNGYDIAKIEKSQYAFPISTLRQIQEDINHELDLFCW